MSWSRGETLSPFRFRTGSIAARLAGWYALSAAAVLAAATLVMYAALADTLRREGDSTLGQQVEVVRSLLADYPARAADLRQEVEVEPLARGNRPPMLIRVLGPGGAVLAQTPGMAAALPTAAFPTPERWAGHIAGGDETDLRTPSADTYHVAATDVEAHGVHYTVQLGMSWRDKARILDRYRRRLTVVLASGLLVSVVIGYVLARRGIGPVTKIARSVDRIESSTLDERLDVAHLPAELRTLGECVNRMMGRIEDGFGRLSRFSADIAHELRTPLASLRGELEVALMRERTPEEYAAVIESCLGDSIRLNRMVEKMLFLARAESEQAHLHREPLDLPAELAKVQAFYELSAGDAGVTVDLRHDGPVAVLADRTLFQSAVGNLIENAVSHTPSGGRVTLAARREGSHAVVEVSDTGSGISPQHLPYVFDRFYRVDQSRSRRSGSLGLGLSLVKSIATLHGGTVRIRSDLGAGTTVWLSFEAIAAASVSDPPEHPSEGSLHISPIIGGE
jgi:two-component system heavy metal sensor histidine kinase CusS